MAKTVKILSGLDANQTLQGAYNDVDGSLTANGYLVGKVGRRVTLAISTTTAAGDTETYTFAEHNGVAYIDLYAIKIVYTTGDRDVLLYAERIS